MNYKEDYITFCNTNWVPLFHKPFWWDMVLNDWDVIRFENKANEIAYLPYASYKKMGFSFSRNPFLTPYSGLVYTKEFSNESKLDFIVQANEFLKQFSISSYNCHYHYNKGLETTLNRSTYLLDLKKPFEEIKLAYSSNIKRQLKKAHKTLHNFEESDTNAFYECYTDSMNKNKVQEIVPRELIDKVYHQTEKDLTSRIFTAYPTDNKQGDAHASIWYICDEKYAYYLLGGSKQKNLGSGAMASLISECILTAQINNKEYFDFEGSDSPGVAQFFAKFGGERVLYPVLSSKTDPKLRALQNLKNKLTK